MYFFSPLESDIYVTLKHFQTPAGSKRGFKNRIIAISLLVSHKERNVVLVPMDFLHLLFELIDLSYVWRIKEHSLECLSQTHLGCWLLSAPKLSLGWDLLFDLTPSLQRYSCYQVPQVVDRLLLNMPTHLHNVFVFLFFSKSCIA